MHEDMWHKGKGVCMLVLGLLVVANAYWMFLDWATFIGGLLVLAGLLKLFMPHKKHR